MLTDKLIQRGKFWEKPWSLVEGCTPVSEGCVNCWLKAMTRFGKCPGDFEGNVLFMDERLTIPEGINRPTIFAVWSDMFHESLSPHDIRAAYEKMSELERHTFLIITKRPENIRPVLYESGEFCLYGDYGLGYLDNVWHIVTVENQAAANLRMPIFMNVPGNKAVIVEPMLSHVDLTPWLYHSDCKHKGIDGGCEVPGRSTYRCYPWLNCPEGRPFLKQVIAGCETGTGARPARINWFKDLAAQCNTAGVPFYLKRVVNRGTRELDGKEHNALVWGDHE